MSSIDVPGVFLLRKAEGLDYDYCFLDPLEADDYYTPAQLARQRVQEHLRDGTLETLFRKDIATELQRLVGTNVETPLSAAFWFLSTVTPFVNELCGAAAGQENKWTCSCSNRQGTLPQFTAKEGYAGNPFEDFSDEYAIVHGKCTSVPKLSSNLVHYYHATHLDGAHSILKGIDLSEGSLRLDFSRTSAFYVTDEIKHCYEWIKTKQFFLKKGGAAILRFSVDLDTFTTGWNLDESWESVVYSCREGIDDDVWRDRWCDGKAILQKRTTVCQN